MTLLSIAQEGARLAEKAGSGPFRGDRFDGTVKYAILAAVDPAKAVYTPEHQDEFRTILEVDHKNGTSGFRDDHTEPLVLHALNHYAALCRAVIDAGEREAKLERGIRDAIAHWKIIAGEGFAGRSALVSILEKALSREQGK